MQLESMYLQRMGEDFREYPIDERLDGIICKVQPLLRIYPAVRKVAHATVTRIEGQIETPNYIPSDGVRGIDT